RGWRRSGRHRRPPRAAARGSPRFSQDVLQHLEIQRLIRDDPLQASVLGLELLQPLCIRDVHAAELPLPAIEGLARDVVPAEQLGHFCARLVLLEDRDDLLFREPALPHLSSLLAAPAAFGTVNNAPDLFLGEGSTASRSGCCSLWASLRDSG